ncbi:MAG: hypothetical protein HYY18_16320 [Planctomycetes bacterium]|nr:hypothetical protein [Planctomycetota bacterium]
MRLLAAMLVAAAAATVSAEPGRTASADDLPNPADLLDLLGSEDPAVRDLGSRALDRLPPERAGDIEELARQATDPEVQAILAAVAARLRHRPLLEKAETLAQETLAHPRRAWRRLLEEDAAALPVLVLWLLRDEKMENPLRDPDCLWGDRPVELGECAAEWLALITGEALGRDPEAWEAWFESRRGLSLEDLAVRALEKRGYPVTDADAEVAAAALIRAISEEPDRHRRALDRDRWYRSLAPTAEWLAQSRILGRPPSRFSVPDVSPAVEAADWLAANRGHVVWRQGGFGSTAGPGEYLPLIEGVDDAARRGALRCLVAFPLEAAPAVRPWLDREPALVAAILASAGSPATPAELPGLLSALEYDLDSPEFAGVWDPDALAEIAAATADDRLRRLALFALASRGQHRHAATAIAWLGCGETDVATAAAVALANLGDESEAKLAVPFIERRPGPVMRSIAVALAARGIPEGFAAARDAAGRGDLLERDLARLARCLEAAPDPRDEDAWKTWASGRADRFEWIEALGKWRVREIK